jgi:hypothetical protein
VKVPYPTEWEAEEVAAYREDQEPGLRLFTYRCPFCGLYHLTKKDQAEYAA